MSDLELYREKRTWVAKGEDDILSVRIPGVKQGDGDITREVWTYTGYRLEVVDEILSLLVSRPVTFEVECREAGLFVSKSQQSRSNCSDDQIREEDQR